MICNIALSDLIHSEIVKAEIQRYKQHGKIPHVENLKYIASCNIIIELHSLKASRRGGEGRKKKTIHALKSHV